MDMKTVAFQVAWALLVTLATAAIISGIAGGLAYLVGIWR